MSRRALRARCAAPRARPRGAPRASLAASPSAPRFARSAVDRGARRARRTRPARRRARAPRCRARRCPRTGRARARRRRRRASRTAPRAPARRSAACASRAAPSGAGRRGVRRSRASRDRSGRVAHGRRIGVAAPRRRSAPSSASASSACSGARELRVGGDDRLGPRPRALQQLRVLGQARDPELPEPRLAGADELALLAQLEVDLGEAEAVGVLGQRPQPRPTPGRARRAGSASGARRGPTRPRSWCSWEIPKRSAFSTSITVALGTSMPTSITVVATSTSRPPEANAAIACLLLARAHPTVQQHQLVARRARPRAAARAPRSPRAARGASAVAARAACRVAGGVLGLLDQRAHDVGLAARRAARSRSCS